MRLYGVIAAAAFLAVLAGCRRDAQPSVVLYVSADEYIARQVAAAFERETGIRVRFTGDTEAKKTTGLVERLRAERLAERPQADVFWSSEIFMTIDLAEEGVFEPHHSDAAADWPAEFRDPEGLWYGFAARARVIAYAPDRLAPEDVPETWMDLAREPLAGRVVMADPRFGTTGGHLGAMKAYWDVEFEPGVYSAWLQGLAANGTRILASGNAGVVRAILAGEADLGMTDTDDVWAAHAQGHELAMVYARHVAPPGATGRGTLLIPNTVARVRGGPNPRTAGVLIDYLLSERVERLLAESVSGNTPLRPELAEEFPGREIPDPLRVDYGRAARERIAAVEEAMSMLRSPGL
jgi:iron(III) transport system substrate-binding protein